jgi:hypothetical protein
VRTGRTGPTQRRRVRAYPIERVSWCHSIGLRGGWGLVW